MPPKSAKVVPEVAPVVKEAKHKTKAAAKSETADKKQVKPAPKGKGAKNAKAAAEDKSSVKKRVKRDKDAPKKPMSPFFCYQAVRRPQLKIEQPTLNNTGIIKAMSVEWN